MKYSADNPASDKLIMCLSFLIVIITPFLSDSYTPSLPAMTKALHASVDQMQMTMSLYLLGVAVSQLFYGPLSDIFGRRPIVLIGLFITVVGSLLCALAPTVFFILMSRLIQGIGAGVCNSLFRAIMRDSFKGSRMAEVSSYSGMFYTLAFAIAPVIGGYLEITFGWRSNFVFTTLLVLSVFLLALFLFPETHHKRLASARKIQTIFANYFILLSSPIFIGYTIISSLGYAGFISYYTVAPFIFINLLHITPVHFGWLSLIIAVGLFLGMYLNAKLISTKGLTTMMQFGMIGILTSGLSMLVFALMGYFNVWVIMCPVIIFAISAGLVFANAMTLAFHPFGHIAGVAGGMYGFIQVFGASLVSFFIASLHEKSQMPFALIITGLGLAILMLNFLLKRYQTE